METNEYEKSSQNSSMKQWKISIDELLDGFVKNSPESRVAVKTWLRNRLRSYYSHSVVFEEIDNFFKTTNASVLEEISEEDFKKEHCVGPKIIELLRDVINYYKQLSVS